MRVGFFIVDGVRLRHVGMGPSRSTRLKAFTLIVLSGVFDLDWEMNGDFCE